MWLLRTPSDLWEEIHNELKSIGDILRERAYCPFTVLSQFLGCRLFKAEGLCMQSPLISYCAHLQVSPQKLIHWFMLFFPFFLSFWWNHWTSSQQKRGGKGEGKGGKGRALKEP